MSCHAVRTVSGASSRSHPSVPRNAAEVVAPAEARARADEEPAMWKWIGVVIVLVVVAVIYGWA